MRLLSVLTLAAILLVPMHAQAQIVGGFGLKLGDVVDVKSDMLEPIAGFGGSTFNGDDAGLTKRKTSTPPWTSR